MVANILNRKKVIAYITTLSKVIFNFNKMIKEVVELDTSYDRLRQYVRDGATRKYWLESDFLVAKE